MVFLAGNGIKYQRAVFKEVFCIHTGDVCGLDAAGITDNGSDTCLVKLATTPLGIDLEAASCMKPPEGTLGDISGKGRESHAPPMGQTEEGKQ